jgi:hypothetical protein
MMLKRSGQAHGIDSILTLRPKGSVVVSCFSCPEPGFNMAEIYDPANEDFRYIWLNVLNHTRLIMRNLQARLSAVLIYGRTLWTTSQR